MNNFDEEDNYEVEETDLKETSDIGGVISRLKEAWKCVPELSFGEMLDSSLNGYSPLQLTQDDLKEMLDEFIIQNQ